MNKPCMVLVISVASWRTTTAVAQTLTGDRVWVGTAIETGAAIDVVAPKIRFGSASYPVDGYPGGTNHYLILDKNALLADASIVFRDRGNARAEFGLVSDNSLRLKTVTGTYPTEVFTDRLIVAPGSSADFFNGLLRNYATSGTVSFVTGNSNVVDAGAGLELSYEFGNTLSRITSIERGNIYRDLVVEANNLRLATGVATVNEALRITSDKRVGIGTDAPTAMLHLRAGTTTANSAPMKFTSGLLLAVPEAGAVEFLTDAYYGTITTGAARRTFAFLESPTFTGTVTLPTPFTLGATSVTTTGTQLNYLNASTGTTGTATKNIVFSDSPVLQSVGNQDYQLDLKSDNYNRGVGIRYIQGTTGGTPTVRNWLVGADSTVGGGFSFIPSTAANNTTFSTPIVFLKDNGNVGIGTTSPLAKLVVNANTAAAAAPINGADIQIVAADAAVPELTLDAFGANANPTITLRRSSGTAASKSALSADAIMLNLRAAGYGSTGYSTARAAIRMIASEAWTDAAQGTYLTFHTTPNSTTTLTERLRLTSTGTVLFNSGLGTGTGGNYLCIDTTTYEVLRGNGSACTASSARFKQHIEPLAYGLREVLRLKPVEYEYRPTFNMGAGRRLGFIAEDVAAVLPEAVTKDEKGQVFGLNDEMLTAALVNAIKELDARVRKLEAR